MRPHYHFSFHVLISATSLPAVELTSDRSCMPYLLKYRKKTLGSFFVLSFASIKHRNDARI